MHGSHGALDLRRIAGRRKQEGASAGGEGRTGLPRARSPTSCCDSRLALLLLASLLPAPLLAVASFCGDELSRDARCSCRALFVAVLVPRLAAKSLTWAMDRFVTRGAPAAREALAKGPKKAKAKQATLESLAKVQVMPHSCLNFGAEELGTLKRRLEDAEASPAQTLDALRVLSSLVISTADLQSSMLGRTVNRLAKRAVPGSEVARLATNLVSKWRAEVDRATAARHGQPARSAAVAKPTPRVPAVLVDSSAAFDAELSSVAVSTTRRRSSGVSGNSRGASNSGAAAKPADERARTRAAMHAALMQGSSSGASRVLALALALEAAVHAAGMPVLTMLSALGANASLRAALLSGWLDPADAAVLTGRALMTSEFL